MFDEEGNEMLDDEEIDTPEEMDEGDEGSGGESQSSNPVTNQAKDLAKEKTQDLVQKSVQTATKKATQQGGAMATKTGLGAVLGPILFWAFIIILILIILVGVIFFIVAMPGQIIAKLKELGQDVLDAFQALVNGAEDVVHTEDMAEVANYLESMGYDLKGEGFVSASSENNSKDYGVEAIYDDEQDVWRNAETEEVLDLNSDPIMTYIVSDNLAYIIKNFNQNLDQASEDAGFWAWAVGLFTAGILLVVMLPVSLIVGTVAVIAGSALAFSLAGNPNWGTGLISIWHESGGIGGKGDSYSKTERGYIELTPETKQLKIKRGWSNQAYTFDVEGWSGRYGMPLEFLLSVHIATHMPDLAIDMATAFETDVEILLRKVNNGNMKARYKMPYGEWVELGELSPTGLNYPDDDKMIELFEKGFPFAEGCTCPSDINPANQPEQTEEGEAEGEGETGESNEETVDPALPHAAVAPGLEYPAAAGTNNSTSRRVCNKCLGQVGKIITALRKVADTDWDTYSPYISKVKDHWFRDVYFVIKDPINTEVIKVDEDYFYQTSERWTIYETYAEGDSIPEGFEVGDYKLYEYDNGTYILSTKTKKEIEEMNEKIANGELDADRLIKKPTTELIEANNGNEWVAYKIVDKTSGWVDLAITEDSPSELQGFEGKIQYYEERPNDIEQVEDGQRGKTNEKIKTMFVNNKYYQYDGTIARAESIEEDRKKLQDGDEKLFNTENDPRKEELLGRVSIARDSLGAFSILENTHTLDADYIYRDFKELIVELNYFDKEDLSDKVQEVMQWPIPDCGSGGWPIRKYEKGETLYGTLINSMVDLELMTSADIELAEKLLEELEAEVESENNTTIAPTGNAPSITVDGLVTKGYEVHKIMEGNGWDYCILNGTGCNHQYGHGCGLNNTIQEAQSGHHNTCCATFVSWVLKEAGFDLSNHPGIHSAKSTYSWCDSEGWTPITDYSQLEPGDLLFNKSGYTGNDTSQIGHVQMLGNDGEWLNAGSVSAINDPPKVYDANFIIGMRSNLNGVAEVFKGYEPNQDVVAPITGKVTEYGEVERINEETGKLETVEFIKIEAIHNYLYDTSSPKGEGYKQCTEIEKNKEYDEFKDKASDEAKKLEGYDYFYEEYQGVLDGFVLYIEGFDLTLFDSDGAKASIEANPENAANFSRYEPNPVYNMTDNLKEARAIWKEDAKAEAIPIITIGEDLYIKEGTIIGKTKEDPDMSEVEIVSKTVTIDGAEEEIKGCTGNGNYIRLILRDLEDAIVEDVESYMVIDEANNQKLEDEKFLYWLGTYIEGGELVNNGGTWSSVPKDLGDGAGKTHYFGITSKWNKDIARKLGYSELAEESGWESNIELEKLVDIYLALIEADKAYVKTQLGDDISDGFLQAFISIKHHYGDLTEARGGNYPNITESQWCTYEGTENKEAIEKRRKAEWILIQEGRYLKCYDDMTDIDFTDGGKYSELTPFTDFCSAHGVTNIQIKSD